MEVAYAQAVRKLVNQGHSPEKAVKSLTDSLTRTGRLALIPRIKRALKRLAEMDARRQPQITVAHEKEAAAATKAASVRLNLPDGGVRVCTDETVIGGWRYIERDRLVDTTYKNQLLDLYNRATR